MTVTEIPVDVPVELDAGALRFAALLGISTGMASAQIRTRPGDASQKMADKQIAGEIDYLTARGVTRRVARRAFRERDRKNPAYRGYRFTEQDAREPAKIYLAAGMTADGLRESILLRDTPESRRMFAMIAAQMEKLAAGGFDAPAYLAEIKQARGDAR